MGCASNPASTHRVGQEGHLLLLGWSHLICQTWWPWFTMHHPLPKLLTYQVLLSSLELHGLRYWRVHIEGATSACLGLTSWEVAVLCALLLLLQPGVALSCCLSLCRWEYRNMKTGENRCKRSDAREQIGPETHELCTFSYWRIPWSWPKPFSGTTFVGNCSFVDIWKFCRKISNSLVQTEHFFFNSFILPINSTAYLY